MKVIRESSGHIPEIISKYIKEKDVCFVFASSIQLESWADWCVKNPSESGVKAIAMEKFIAWDHFKEKFAISSVDGKTAIPSILRKLFVSDFIERNASLCKENKPLLKKLIVPEYSSEAENFVSSISAMLPMLKKWKENFDLLRKENPEYVLDEEDMDYLVLFQEYSNFLGDDLFEPAWLIPDFSKVDKKFILLYPEQLLDFQDYEPLFNDNDNIIIYKLPIEKKYKQKVRVFSDARKELRRTLLKIKEIVESSNGTVGYDDVAVHIKNLDSVRSYVEREFDKYRIPCVVRKAENVLINSAASIFIQIKNCVSSNYSYESMRTLLLNSFIPWKEIELNENLIREGSVRHIICNYEKGDKNDEWIKTLGNIQQDYREYEYYKALKKAMESFYNASSFENIRKAWILFKKDFLTESWTEKANLVLGKCITELDKIIQIEKDFAETKNIKIMNPFNFFVSELQNLNYAPQIKINGVSVFEYRVACCTAYKYNFILNSSQKALTVSYRPLAFLNAQKRKMLNFFDNDLASEVFIELYGWNNSETEEKGFFTCSIDSFDGFAIPHSYLEVNKDQWEYLDECDFVIGEQKFFLSDENTAEKSKYVKLISDKQIDEFHEWKKVSNYIDCNKSEFYASNKLKDKIDNILKVNRSGKFFISDDSYLDRNFQKSNEEARSDCSNVKITQSDLDSFFICPRYWLFKNVLLLKEDTLDVDLFSIQDQGIIMHKALELILSDFEKRNKKLPCVDENGSFGDEETEMIELVKKSVNEAIHHNEMSFSKSPLVIEVLESQVNNIEATIFGFMKKFCESNDKGKAGGFEVLSTEKWLSGKKIESKYVLTGKMDLLLKDDEGRVYIIDFKNKKCPSIKSCKYVEVSDDSGSYLDLNNFQCAMYVTLWNLNSQKSNYVKGMAFESIKEGKANTVFWSDEEAQDYEKSQEVLSKYTDIFYEITSSYNFEPNSYGNDLEKKHYMNVDSFEKCFGCKYKHICRTSYIVGQKRLKSY